MIWLRIYEHLLPRAKAWQITIDKNLRRFFVGIAGLPESIKDAQDQTWNDYRPAETTKLSLWEDQFALQPYGLTEQEKRDRLDATWKAQGGQDPRYIQGTLQAAGFDVYVHEWWEPTSRVAGGSVNNDDVPVARNPFDYLDDGTTGLRYLMFDGGVDAHDGDPVSQDGGTNAPVGYPLVNKVIISSEDIIGDGSPGMQDGDPDAQDGSFSVNYKRKQYIIPVDSSKYPYFLYIGGEVFPNIAEVPESRREEFEDLCLKICPCEQWLGILINYS